jgi:hypothetical protein
MLSLLGKSADAESTSKVTATDSQVCTREPEELKMMVDQLLAQVTPLETQIGVLNSNIIETTSELCAKSLSLERSTTAKDDFQRETTKLTKKVEGK